ncbi:MAG TPA: PIN domain-containing protein [Verrucomicrobiales bacterium]|nr:PIN domain-containing protein [Verrucomicrobiales bacterium]
MDTNAVSALAAKNPAILRRLEHAQDLAVSFISFAKFHFGLLASARPGPGLALLEQLAATVPVLFPVPETIAHYAWIADHLKGKGRPIPQNDMWTAALARQHALPVLSRDRHFDFIDGLRCLDW